MAMGGYELLYGELAVAVYACGLPTGCRDAGQVAAAVQAIVARLGLAEIVRRAQELHCADLTAYRIAVCGAPDRPTHAQWDARRLDWARGVALHNRVAVPAPMAFFETLAALWGWSGLDTADTYLMGLMTGGLLRQRAADIIAHRGIGQVRAAAREALAGRFAPPRRVLGTLDERRWNQLRTTLAALCPDLLSSQADSDTARAGAR
jgi:hypothetical protein